MEKTFTNLLQNQNADALGPCRIGVKFDSLKKKWKTYFADSHHPQRVQQLSAVFIVLLHHL